MHVLAGDALTKENVHILPCCNNDVNCANINSNISRQRPHTWPGLSSSAVSVSKTWGLNWTPQVPVPSFLRQRINGQTFRSSCLSALKASFIL